MFLLDLLWLVSLGVFVASGVTILLVLLRRLVLDARNSRWQRRRWRLETLLFRYLDGHETAAAVHAASDGRRGAVLLAAILREILELLRGEDADRLKALLDAPRLVGVILHAAGRGTRAARLDAIETLLLIPSASVIAPLRRLAITDADPGIRAAAARALHARDPDLLDSEVLTAILADPAAAPLIAPLLRRLAVERTDALLRLLALPQPADVLAALLEGLAFAADYRLAVRVAGFVEHEDAGVRACAVAALARFGDPRTGTEVVRALRDPAWEVRTAAAAASGAMRLSVALPILADLLADEVWPARYAAALALLELGEAGRLELTARAVRGDRAGRISQMVLAEHEALALVA